MKEQIKDIFTAIGDSAVPVLFVVKKLTCNWIFVQFAAVAGFIAAAGFFMGVNQ